MNPILKKALLFYSLISLAVIAIVGSQLYVAKTTAKNEIKTNLENVAKTTEIAIKATLDNINLTLTHIAYDIEKDPDLVKGDMAERLNKYKNTFVNAGNLEFRVADANGDLVQSTGSEFTKNGPKINFANREYFQYLKVTVTDEPFMSEPIMGAVSNKMVMILSRRLADKNGKFLGLVFASIKVDFFNQFVAPIHLESKDIITMAGGKRNFRMNRFPFLADAKLGKEIEVHRDFDPVLKGELPSKLIEIFGVLDGIHRYTSLSRVSNYNVIVLVGRDIDSRLASWRMQCFYQLGLVILLLLLGLAFIISFTKAAKKISDQQVQLVSSAKFVALGEMSGSIGHEINNPLAVIVGSSEQLVRMVNQSSTDFALYRAKLERITKMVDRITKIVSGLKKFSRQAEGEMNEIAISSVIDGALEISSERFRVSDIELRKNLQCEGLFFKGNEVQIMQVIVNLLNNSYDAVGGLSTKWVSLDCEERSRKIFITVTDSGSGIPEEVANRIMEPFFTTKEVGKGTGLGLSIAKGIIEAHGGIFSYDKNCANTRFVIELPLLWKKFEHKVA